ncbi:uncharacterized protein [Haliotis asinina]|uniref:uncharacterized protein n=1 Tax=Haliotis asinina TaxID=109174 RepID=UPI0035323545
MSWRFIPLRAGTGLQLCDPDHTPNEESTYLLQSNILDVTDASYNNGRSTYLQGDRGCPQHNQSTRATCPTYFSLNFDPNREPPTIAEVNCACENCRYETDESPNACVPVYYYRNVLEREARRRCYRWRVRAFRVGCQCLGARTDGTLFTQTQE